ncbi:helix-turn-helix domain-containing protein [Shewanella psychrotolerans]|uniref:helix-turn-helix domain-containing protein n=1 Tax=Shewanella psychrotolerans TaxID=2864206 RepID=UPI001C65B4E4|nr:helix-turn-helix domain-containing protein [Shewanella psychrotolerans]QYK02420.1 helix-turn-helix domain-containing protein [Shewanella psychrotolerans]
MAVGGERYLRFERIIDHLLRHINTNDEEIRKKLKKTLLVDGGKPFVERLVHIFGLRSKVELSTCIGVSTGSIATWQTRKTLPFELVVRLHLATGISVEYLLFEELKGDLNVMQYLPDPTEQPNFANIKHNLGHFHYSLSQPAKYDGGAVLIDRLLSLFKLPSKVALAELIGTSEGTIYVWHTRKTTPHELLCRVHLATGVSMHYLCFGKEWNDVVASKQYTEQLYADLLAGKVRTYQASEDPGSVLPVKYIRVVNGKANIVMNNYSLNPTLADESGISAEDGLVIRNEGVTYFIDKSQTDVVKGQYLIDVNSFMQIVELRLLPDGKVYVIDGEDKYPINPDTTKVIGKVVSVLKKV